MTPDAISKCWHKIFFRLDDWDSEDLVPLSRLKETRESAREDEREIAEINNMLQKVSSENSQLTESEIREWIVGDEHLPLHSDEGDSEEKVVRIQPKVKYEAICCFSTCIQWAEENDVELNALSMLRMLQQRAMQAKHSSNKQSIF